MTPTRDLVYVKDTVEGFLKIASSEVLIGHEVNIASETEISIGDLANIIISKINPKAKILQDQTRLRPKKSEVYRLFGSNKKLRTNTNWEQNYFLDEAITETIEWFSNKDLSLIHI